LLAQVGTGDRCSEMERGPLGASDLLVLLVGDTGFEPVTSSVSRKRATTAPIARDDSKIPQEEIPSNRGGDGI
jgi:hypothetical protein